MRNRSEQHPWWRGASSPCASPTRTDDFQRKKGFVHALHKKQNKSFGGVNSRPQSFLHTAHTTWAGRGGRSQHGTKTLHAQARQVVRRSRAGPPRCTVLEKPAHARCEVFTAGRTHDDLETTAKTRHKIIRAQFAKARSLKDGRVSPTLPPKLKHMARWRQRTTGSDSK